jgi:hypothetical protein
MKRSCTLKRPVEIWPSAALTFGPAFLDLNGRSPRCPSSRPRFPSIRTRSPPSRSRCLCLTLKLSLAEYRKVRSRFISTFKRDKLLRTDPSDIKIIQDGNVTAHGGDTVVDAMLYEGVGGRHDSSAFKKLYEIHPAIVPTISE